MRTSHHRSAKPEGRRLRVRPTRFLFAGVAGVIQPDAPAYNLPPPGEPSSYGVATMVYLGLRGIIFARRSTGRQGTKGSEAGFPADPFLLPGAAPSPGQCPPTFGLRPPP